MPTRRTHGFSHASHFPDSTPPNVGVEPISAFSAQYPPQEIPFMFFNNTYSGQARQTSVFVSGNGSATLVINNSPYPDPNTTPPEPNSRQYLHPDLEQEDQGSVNSIRVPNEMGTTAEGRENGGFDSDDLNLVEASLGVDQREPTDSFEELTKTIYEPDGECINRADASVGESNDERLEGRSYCDSRGIDDDETAEHPSRTSDSDGEEYELARQDESSDDGNVDSEHSFLVAKPRDCDTVTILSCVPPDSDWESDGPAEEDHGSHTVPSERTVECDNVGHVNGSSNDNSRNMGEPEQAETSQLVRCDTVRLVATEESGSPLASPSIVIDVADANVGLQQSGGSGGIDDKVTVEVPFASDLRPILTADGDDHTLASEANGEEGDDLHFQGNADLPQNLPCTDDSTAAEELAVIPAGKANVTKEGGHPVPSEATVEASHGEHLCDSGDVDDPPDSRRVVEAEKDGDVNIIVQDSDAQGELTFIVSAKETDVTEADDWTDLGVTEISPPPVPVRTRGG